MLKEKRYVKAVKYVCAFGLREKFQPATLLKDFMKNALEVSKTLCENISSPVNKKVSSLSLFIFWKFFQLLLVHVATNFAMDGATVYRYMYFHI